MVLATAAIALPGTGAALPFKDFETVSTTGGDADLDVAPDGSAVIVWEDSRDVEGEPSNSILVQLSAADGSSGKPVEVDADTGQNADPVVELAPDGTATVVWAAYKANALKAARVAPDGSVSALPSTDLHGTLDVPGVQTLLEPSGAIAVAWQETNDHETHRLKAVQLGADGTWGPAHTLLENEDYRALDAGLQPAGDGAATVVWTDVNDSKETDVELRAARLLSDGTLGEIQFLADRAGSDLDLFDDFAVAGRRVLFTANEHKNRAGDEVKLRMVTVGDDGEALAPAEVIDSVSSPYAGFYDLDAAVDESGVTTVVWSSRENGPSHPRSRIEALRIDDAGVVDRLGAISRKDRSRSTDPVVTATRPHQSEIVWTRAKKGDKRQLGAAKIRATGAIRRQRFAGADVGEGLRDLHAAADGSGRVRITFQTARPSDEHDEKSGGLMTSRSR